MQFVKEFKAEVFASFGQIDLNISLIRKDQNKTNVEVELIKERLKQGNEKFDSLTDRIKKLEDKEDKGKVSKLNLLWIMLGFVVITIAKELVMRWIK
jgi:hypothetical protein